MNVCVDVGNTTISIGFFENDSLVERLSFQTDTLKTQDEFHVLINQQIYYRQIDVNRAERIIYSSVVPEVNRALLGALKAIFKKDVLVVTPGIKTGLLMKVDNPNEVGSDLVADLVGIKEKYGYPSLICDLGTASKILLIDKNGAFSSCLILPGLSLSAASLSKTASLLPNVSLEAPKTILAKNTIDAMNAGIVFGHTEMLNGLVQRIENELGYTCKKVLTGGGALYIKDILGEVYSYEPDICLYGLNLLIKKNEVKKYAK